MNPNDWLEYIAGFDQRMLGDAGRVLGTQRAGDLAARNALPYLDPATDAVAEAFKGWTGRWMPSASKITQANNVSDIPLQIIWPLVYAAMMNDPGTRATFGPGEQS